MFEPGDIAACYGTDCVSRTISRWTGSPCLPRRLRIAPSHVAIIARLHSQPAWVESTSLCHRECLVRGEQVSGCQVHRPWARVSDYLRDGGHVELYRPNPLYRFTAGEQTELSSILINHFVLPGASYDTRGAVLSGTRVLQLLPQFPAADIEAVFCSELIAAVLMRMHRMPIDNPSRFNPARLMRQLVRTGMYEFHRRCSPDQMPLQAVFHEGEAA